MKGKVCVCIHCGHEWYTRIPTGRPGKCPNCQTIAWDREKRTTKKGTPTP